MIDFDLNVYRLGDVCIFTLLHVHLFIDSVFLNSSLQASNCRYAGYFNTYVTAVIIMVEFMVPSLPVVVSPVWNVKT